MVIWGTAIAAVMGFCVGRLAGPLWALAGFLVTVGIAILQYRWLHPHGLFDEVGLPWGAASLVALCAGACCRRHVVALSPLPAEHL